MFADTVESLAAEVIELATDRGTSIVTAESCTAGRLACVLADTRGAGGTLLGGFVSYDKQFKSGVLRVPSYVLRAETAVSPRVAEAMAQGALEASDADVAVAITGVAGPDPDQDDNGVGLVYIALAGSNGQRGGVKLELGEQPPDDIKDRAVVEALVLMRDALLSWKKPLSTLT
jgi:nicotinamide-nucleotide amidase